jgi:hypothetical protein
VRINQSKKREKKMTSTYLGPITKIRSNSPNDIFFSSGPCLYRRINNQNPPRLILQLPEGRIISSLFEIHESCGFLAAHNEVFFFSFDEQETAIPEYCGRSLDRVLDLKVLGEFSVLCLGHEGVVCIFSKNQKNTNWSKTFLCQNSPLGMCIAGSIMFQTENSKSFSFLLGTSFGDVVEFTCDENERSFSESCRISKCHQNGMVSCMSRVKKHKSVSYFATASDERRACLVFQEQSENNHEDGILKKNLFSNPQIFRISFEPGRIRSVDCFHSGNGFFFVATGCEDGWIRCYKISQLEISSEFHSKIIFAKQVHGGGIGGGAGSLELSVFKDEQFEIVSGGFDGKMIVSEFNLNEDNVETSSFSSSPIQISNDAQLRCVSSSNDSNELIIFGAFANGEIKKFSKSKEPSTFSSSSIPSQSGIPCIIINNNINNSDDSSVFVGTTSGSVFFASSKEKCELIHSHSQKSAITSLEQRGSLIYSGSASGSIAVTNLKDTTTTFSAHDVCQGRTLILPGFVQDQIFLVACDRRGVYLFWASNDENDQILKSKKIYNSSEAFPGRADLWNPSCLHWESSGASWPSSPHQLQFLRLRFSIVHKNRMYQVFECSTNSFNKVEFASIPTPICPDLPVRDVLFSNRNFALVHSGNQIILWDRQNNEKHRSSSIDDMTATRLRSISLVENHLNFVWSHNTNEIHFHQFDIDQSNNNNNQNSWSSSDLTCSCSISSSVFITGADDGSLCIWTKKQAQSMKKSNTLHLHPSSVLALCSIPNFGFVSVGAHSTIGIWRANQDDDETQFDLAFSKVAAPLSKSEKNNNSNSSATTRTREAELERFISCAAVENVVVVGSSCGGFFVFEKENRKVQEAEEEEGSFVKWKEHHIAPTEKSFLFSPVISISVVAASAQSIVVLCGLNNGKLSAVNLRLCTENSETSSYFHRVHESDDVFHPDQKKNEGAITCLLPLLRTEDGTIPKSIFFRLFVAKENGSLYLIDFSNFVAVANVKRIETFAAATPRVLLYSKRNKMIGVVEEGRRIFFVSEEEQQQQQKQRTEKYSSVVRIRGGCLVDQEGFVVVGQGIEYIRFL